MSNSIYDTYFTDTDLSLDKTMEDVRGDMPELSFVDELTFAFGGDVDNYGERKYMEDHDPSSYFWKYNKSEENLLKKRDTIKRDKLSSKKDDLIGAAIDTSFGLSDEYGKTNLTTGQFDSTTDSLYQELNISSDDLMTKEKLSRIKTGRSIDKLRSSYLLEREEQRQKYKTARAESAIEIEANQPEDPDFDKVYEEYFRDGLTDAWSQLTYGTEEFLELIQEIPYVGQYVSDSLDWVTERTKGRGRFTNWNNPAKWEL